MPGLALVFSRLLAGFLNGTVHRESVIRQEREPILAPVLKAGFTRSLIAGHAKIMAEVNNTTRTPAGT